MCGSLKVGEFEASLGEYIYYIYSTLPPHLSGSITLPAHVSTKAQGEVRINASYLLLQCFAGYLFSLWLCIRSWSDSGALCTALLRGNATQSWLREYHWGCSLPPCVNKSTPNKSPFICGLTLRTTRTAPGAQSGVIDGVKYNP